MDFKYPQPEPPGSPSMQSPVPPRLSLLQSITLQPNPSSLQCSGMTPNPEPAPNAQTSGHSPFAIDEYDEQNDDEEYGVVMLSDSDNDEEPGSAEESDSDDDESSGYDSDDSDLPMSMLLGMLSVAEADTVFAENGYKKLRRVCDSLQGEVFQCEIFRETERNQRVGRGHLVAIKKVSKELDAQSVAEQEGVTLMVAEDIKKEALILRHLTVDNHSMPTARDLVGFVEYFEAEEHLYLVTEWVEGCTLSEFVATAHEHIAAERLSRDEYTECIQGIMWRLVLTIKWLHSTMKCVHLDLCCENVMVTGIRFVDDGDRRVRLEGAVAIKLLDFGVAEIFDTPRNRPLKPFTFECMKDGNELNVERAANHAPESSIGSVYDARGTDIWSLGMILFEAMAGEPLYRAKDIWNAKYFAQQNGFWAVKRSKMREYLEGKGLMMCFGDHCFSLLSGLLAASPRQRISSNECLRHVFFKKFYRRNFYAAKLKKKQKRWLCDEQRLSFPYYTL